MLMPYSEVANQTYSKSESLQNSGKKGTQFCRHRFSCQQNALRGFLKTFGAAFSVDFVLSLASGLLSGRIVSHPARTLRIGAKDGLRFAIFLSSCIGGSKLLNCALRLIRGKEDSYNALIAGSIAGLSVLFDNKKRRTIIALYLLTRALNFSYNYAVEKLFLRQIPHGDVVLMALCNAQIMYSFMNEPQMLSPDYLHFVQTQSCKSLATMNGVRASIRTGDSACLVFHPNSSCLSFLARQFFMDSFVQALKLYIPFTLFFSVALKGRRLLVTKAIASNSFKIVTSALRSSVFLASYTLATYIVTCASSVWIGRVPANMYYLAGMLSGSAVLLEKRDRRLELGLYCAPRALQALWSSLVHRGYVRNIPNGEVLIFSVSFAGLLGFYQNENQVIPESYRGFLSRFLGDN